MENVADTDQIVTDADAIPASGCPEPAGSAAGQPGRGSQASPRQQQQKVRLRTLDDIDGRTLAAKRAHSLVTAIEADIGVDLSAAEHQLAQRAGGLGLLSQ